MERTKPDIADLRDVSMTDIAARLLVVGQPMLFAAAVVLSRYLSLPAAPQTLIRPVVIAVLLAAAALVVARVLTRSWSWAALLSTLFVLFTLRESVPAAVLGAFVVWQILLSLLRRREGRPPISPRVTGQAARASAIYGLAFFVVTVASVVATTTDRPSASPPRLTAEGTGGPNIYVLMLDGYPRADTLAEVFRVNNQPFIAALEEEGFEVAENAQSNYNKTWLTLASMLNATYIDELLDDREPPPQEASQIRWLQSLINESSFPRLLRERGYTVHALPPPFTSAALASADRVIDGGHLTEFEAKLMSASPWTIFLQPVFEPFVAQSLKGSVVGTLDGIAAIAEERRGGPRFVLAHVHSPHPPFVLAESAGSLPDCAPTDCSAWDSSIEETGLAFDDYRTALEEQVLVLNELVLASVKRIKAADPRAVVVVMSDHGSRYSLRDGDEHFKILLGIRAPGHVGLLEGSPSPVNIFRLVANAYFGADMQPLEYRAWLSDWNATLTLTPFLVEAARRPGRSNAQVTNTLPAGWE